MNVREFIRRAEPAGWMLHVDQAMAPTSGWPAKSIAPASGRLLRSRWNGYRVLAGVCAARRTWPWR